jgi:DNA-binding cell septation regulator SpoVG
MAVRGEYKMIKNLFGETLEQKIEVVRLFRFENDSPIRAFCDIQIGEEFIIKGFRVLKGQRKLFVGMPGQLNKYGKWYNTFMPINEDIKKRIEDVILSAYKE